MMVRRVRRDLLRLITVLCEADPEEHDVIVRVAVAYLQHNRAVIDAWLELLTRTSDAALHDVDRDHAGPIGYLYPPHLFRSNLELAIADMDHVGSGIFELGLGHLESSDLEPLERALRYAEHLVTEPCQLAMHPIAAYLPRNQTRRARLTNDGRMVITVNVEGGLSRENEAAFRALCLPPNTLEGAAEAEVGDGDDDPMKSFRTVAYVMAGREGEVVRSLRTAGFEIDDDRR